MRRILVALGTMLVAASVYVVPAGAQTLPCDPVPELDDRCESWVASFTATSPTDAQDFWEPPRVVTSPDGELVFVAGRVRDGGPTGSDIATVAYDSATGEQVWTDRYDGPASKRDVPSAIAVSPDGGTLYVAGTKDARLEEDVHLADFVVLAYEAETGVRRWVAVYDGPADRRDAAVHMAASARQVVVAGTSRAEDGTNEFATVAFDPATGALSWAARRTPAEAWPQLRGLALDPAGRRAFVVSSEGRRQVVSPGTLGGTSYEYLGGHMVTVAYNDRGEELWLTRHGSPGSEGDEPWDVAVSPGGESVYVAGATRVTDDESNTLALAYGAADGALRWEVTRDTRPGEDDWEVGWALGVAPAGDSVFVGVSAEDFRLLGLRAADGSAEWSATYGTPAHGEVIRDLAVSPDGARVYATGWAFRFIAYMVGGWSSCDSEGNCSSGQFSNNESQSDYATVAFEADDGTIAWAARYNETDSGVDFDLSSSLAVGGNRVFVTGLFSRLMGFGNGLDFARYGTVAYPA